MNALNERVERGAALLDEHRPAWWRSVVFRDLEMWSCSKCVLGQVYGRFGDGLDDLWPSGWNDEETFQAGFDLPLPRELADWDRLADLWREQVRIRRRAARSAS